MGWLSGLVELALHADQHLSLLVAQTGSWIYGLLFLTIFSETGFVVLTFLPGDTLVFAAATQASKGVLSLPLLYLLMFAAMAGDSSAYWIGRFLGPRIFHHPHSWFDRSHLQRVHRFYEKRGGWVIFLSRYIPIMRSLGPLVAGVANMDYRRFLVFNAAGVAVWFNVLLLGGYYFGKLPQVKEHFTLVVLGVFGLSLIPATITFIVHQMNQREKGKP